MRWNDMSLYSRRIVFASSVLLIAYFSSWVIVYSIVMKGDYSFIAKYFLSGWSGGGELPTFIQAGSLLLTLILAGAYFLYWSRSKRNI